MQAGRGIPMITHRHAKQKRRHLDMKVVICGAGQVGYGIARHLASSRMM